MKLKLSRKWLVLIVCVALVAVSGYALAANNQLSNPFTAVSEVTRLISADSSTVGGGMQSRGGGEGTDRPAPPSGDFAGGEGSGGGPGGGQEGAGIQWSQVGAVLANLWVIAAATVVMAVVGPMIGWSIKHLRPKRARREPTLEPAA